MNIELGIAKFLEARILNQGFTNINTNNKSIRLNTIIISYIKLNTREKIE